MPLKVNKAGNWVETKKVNVRKGTEWVPAKNWHTRKGGFWVPAWVNNPPYYDNGAENPIWVQGYTSGSGGQAKNADHLYLEQNNLGMRSFVTETMVDLTGINKLYIDWDLYVEPGAIINSSFAYLIVATVKDGDHNNFDGVRLFIGEAQQGRRVDSIDVSSLSGNFYIRNQLRYAGVSGTTLLKLKTYKIWGE